MSDDLAALRNWVTAADGERFSRLPEGVVSVNVSHSNITAHMIELKFDLSHTVRAIQKNGGKEGEGSKDLDFSIDPFACFETLSSSFVGGSIER